MSSNAKAKRNDGTGLVDIDPWLEPYSDALRRRHSKYVAVRKNIEEHAGSLAKMSRGHEYFGFNRGEREGVKGVWYREWAPGAEQLTLIGSFNNWDRGAHLLQRDEFGVWSIFLPDTEYANSFTHGSHVKVHVLSKIEPMDRIPAYIKLVEYDKETHNFTGIYWNPPVPFAWQNEPPTLASGLRVYEAHVGMAQEEPRVGTYDEFRENVLPRVAASGYNALQLMAIQEHPYYGSFGYHVSNFFAASSRFGTPHDLKRLIDTAHGMGLLVLLDLIHSHSVKNLFDGLNLFDGTPNQYFHPGGRGEHPNWDSKLFDYGKWEVQRFLLSNVRFWLDEYRFDGYRFDGVTSMLYHHHGNKAFTCYDDYLNHDVDDDALVYVQLANEVVKETNPKAITIAEEVSGMVGLARPVCEGGLGFDYRLAMGIPDYWIKLLKERSDEDWSMGEMFRTLTNRRHGEKHIAYAESHDQALVGDKTLAFWLMDADMYWHMNLESRNPIIDRGIALHKMIRLITFTLGGEGYLNFIGNEFGHPEWVDFPREGNGFSCKHARRQWSLVDNELLRYKHLAAFDLAMQKLDIEHRILEDPILGEINIDEEQKVLICHRGPLVFAFNFHPNRSYEGYRLGTPEVFDYQLVLNTDTSLFGGFSSVPEHQIYPHQKEQCHGRESSVQIYLPARTAQVLAPLRP